MQKVNFHNLANILTNINDKIGNFIKKRSVMSNQLPTFYYQLSGTQKKYLYSSIKRQFANRYLSGMFF